MKTTHTLAFLAAIASFAAIPAASAQDVTCENANFSEEITNRFAGIRYSCIEIVELNGESHAKLNAEVVRVWAPKITMRFKRSDGGTTNPVTFTPARDMKFIVDEQRKEVGLRELTPTTELRVYVPVRGPVGKLGFDVDADTGEVTWYEIEDE